MTTRDFVPLTQFTELKNNFLKLNDRRNKLEIENTKLKELLRKVVKMTAVYEKIQAAANVDCIGYYKLIKKINQALGEDK